MAIAANRKPIMTLFSTPRDPAGHRTRIVLAEKNISAENVEIAAGERLPDDLADVNPYGSLPTLMDRDLALYSAHIIMEYLDERYPHPPLMPVDPVSRARFRLFLYRIERDWYAAAHALDQNQSTGTAASWEAARKTIRDGLIAIAPIFEQKPFFMSDEFSLVDCSVAPILWRLPLYKIELPDEAKAIYKYAERLFKRDSFRASLTDLEREMRLT